MWLFCQSESDVMEVIHLAVLTPGMMFTLNCLPIDQLSVWGLASSNSLKGTHTQSTVERCVRDLGTCLTAKAPWGKYSSTGPKKNWWIASRNVCKVISIRQSHLFEFTWIINFWFLGIWMMKPHLPKNLHLFDKLCLEAFLFQHLSCRAESSDATFRWSRYAVKAKY